MGVNFMTLLDKLSSYHTFREKKYFSAQKWGKNNIFEQPQFSKSQISAKM